VSLALAETSNTDRLKAGLQRLSCPTGLVARNTPDLLDQQEKVQRIGR
jgi:hypothetical protein